MNSDQEEGDRKRKLNAWLAFKRKASQIAASYQLDGTKIITAVDQEIEIATNRLQCLHELDDSDFAALQYAHKLPGALIEARANLLWSQRMLAAQVGLTKQQISRSEISNYSDIGLSKAILIAQVLQTALG